MTTIYTAQGLIARRPIGFESEYCFEPDTAEADDLEPCVSDIEQGALPESNSQDEE